MDRGIFGSAHPAGGAPQPADPRWRVHLTIGDRWARWCGRAGDAASHRHFAAQAIQAPDGARVHLGPGQVIAGEWILIDPLVAHRLEPVAGVTLHFLEPAAAAEPALAETLQVFRHREGVLVAAHPTAPFWAPWLRDDAAARRPHGETLATGLRRIDAQLGDGVLRLPAIARDSGLSPSRFRHLFAQEIGLPFRRYVLWRRLRLAVTEMGAGADATTAAHAAGFADLAHFSRTLKAMFGVTATQALRRAEPPSDQGWSAEVG